VKLNEAREAPAGRPGFFYGYVIAGAFFLIMVAIWGAYYSYGVFFKPLLNEFGWSRSTTSAAFSISMLVNGLLSIPLGGLTDRLGTRLVMTICGVFLGAGYMLMALVDSPWQIYLFYTVIIGTGMVAGFVPPVSAIVRWFVTRRGAVTGFILAGSSAGALIGPPVASRLISAYDWRYAFLIMGAFVLVVTTLISQFLRRDPAQVGQTPYGENTSKQDLLPPQHGYSLAAAIQTRQLWIFFVALICLGYCFFVYTVHITPRTSDLGFSATSAATALSALGAGSIIGRLGMGAAADYLGYKRVYLVGSIASALVMFALVPARELWSIYLLSAIMGLTQGGTGTLISPLQAELFGVKSHGLILAVIGLGYTIGAAVGPIVAGYQFDMSGRYEIAFLTTAVIAVAGFIFIILLKPIKPGRNRNITF
jgi:MFS family permease